MIPIGALFESHLTVSNLERSMAFYGDALGLQLAHVVPERRVAFYWLGGAGKSMLGLWEIGAATAQPPCCVSGGTRGPAGRAAASPRGWYHPSGLLRQRLR